jgi:Periplasmic copper-binding protein (NosD)
MLLSVRRALSVPSFALLLAVVAGFAPGRAAAATVLRVPSGYPSIQAAIDAAAPGDTVLVAAGHYSEQIDFQAKAITVASESGAEQTTIDGGGFGAVVVINANGGETPVLRGFTVTGGGGNSFPDGAIDTSGGPALIENNIITGNRFCDDGAVSAAFSTATIRDNVISDNSQVCSGGVGGAGVSIRGDGSVQVLHNVISGNIHSAAAGGVGLFAAGRPTIEGNVIKNNVGWQGGGMSLFNDSDALIENNIIVGNQAAQGGGIYWTVPSGARGPYVINNTIANNPANDGLAIYGSGFDSQASLLDNVLAGDGTGSVVSCGNYEGTAPSIRFNDVRNSGTGARYSGTCSDLTGSNGNVSVDPRFLDAASGDYHLQPGSPVVDRGTNEGAPTVDIDGDARPFDGNGDGLAVTDIGADEVTTVASDTTPPTISCSATPNVLWPPNQSLVAVTVTLNATDDSGSVRVTLDAVTNSQADSGLDRSDLPNDIQGWTAGTDDRSGYLRAERFEAFRVYTLTYSATDPSGNTATCQTTVTVPLKQQR